ncbi:fimbria/pilus outer membrane usher protein [Pseudomonas sp. NPDC089396]|uniref:fimbria/pilus outer membrane usher protein n=1 Tax=Pseudomonas sp. NPDC089396 TaxID=3364461 RepID=UPI00383789B3
MLKPLRHRQPLSRLRSTPLRALSCGCLVLITLPGHANGESPALHFNSGFMRQAADQPADAGALALHSLGTQQTLIAGRYSVEVTLNLQPIGKRDIDFHDSPDGEQLTACLTPALLRALGVREQSLEHPLPEDDSCVDLATLLPDARAELDPATMRLAISIAQINLSRDVAGKVPSEHWDSGIPAAFVNYQASAQHTSRRGQANRSSQDLYLNGGVNLGGWRLRSSQALREDPEGKRHWTRTNTYLQHDLPEDWGTLTLGETFSNGDVFRSQPFKGVQLASDLGMLPDVMQSYAPVIRGVAQSRAKLEVLQNGYPIYSTYVAQGPYVIDDLSVGGGGSDLEVVLTEADGQVRRFIQPYSNLSNLLRDGVWRYSLAMGRYQSADHLDDPSLWQGTLARGGLWGSTLYGGMLSGDYYRAFNLGVARDLGAVGALSFDVTRARSDLGRQLGEVQGNSFAARYGKSFETGTHLRFAGYRYSTEGYRDFDEVVQQRSASKHFVGSRRSRMEAAVYQRLDTRSNVSLTLSQDDYWRTNLQRRQYQFQYTTQVGKHISLNLYASQSLSDQPQNDRIIGLGLTIPLDFLPSSSATFDLQQSAGKYSQRASLAADALDNRLNYRASLANDEQQNKTASLSLGLQTAHANYGLGYTEGSDLRSVSANASGALLAHEGGLLNTPYLGESVALVHVPGIPDVGVENAPAARTNGDGYVVAPYLRPYRINQLVLQTDDLGPQVEIDNGTTQVVPRRGAVVKATFPARQVTRLVLTLLQADGRPLPFGAQVMDQQGNPLAVVGQGGQALVATHAQAQTLNVHWQAGEEQSCSVNVDPDSMREQDGYHLQTLRCDNA